MKVLKVYENSGGFRFPRSNVIAVPSVRDSFELYFDLVVNEQSSRWLDLFVHFTSRKLGIYVWSRANHTESHGYTFSGDVHFQYAEDPYLV